MGMGKTVQAIALVLAKRALCREHDVFNLKSRVGNPGYRLPKAMSTVNATLSTQISKKMEFHIPFILLLLLNNKSLCTKLKNMKRNFNCSDSLTHFLYHPLQGEIK
ncbi:hypothetical protein L1987_47617 [Smallanthus sonchifolius]|uniref:Uncharacterized protein n=1 Tax=Smallanthus sonchifolius TaxID=185202 RepID=A0ACB9G324_9ASTR|nr:hypothetical protein L1987_47617 [Smallanthus sonchifolius]